MVCIFLSIFATFHKDMKEQGINHAGAGFWAKDLNKLKESPPTCLLQAGAGTGSKLYTNIIDYFR